MCRLYSDINAYELIQLVRITYIFKPCQFVTGCLKLKPTDIPNWDNKKASDWRLN